jgi:hypothetical protein
MRSVAPLAHLIARADKEPSHDLHHQDPTHTPPAPGGRSRPGALDLLPWVKLSHDLPSLRRLCVDGKFRPKHNPRALRTGRSRHHVYYIVSDDPDAQEGCDAKTSALPLTGAPGPPTDQLGVQRLVRDKHVGAAIRKSGAALFLVTVADAQGLSFYANASTEWLLSLSSQRVTQARQGLLRGAAASGAGTRAWFRAAYPLRPCAVYGHSRRFVDLDR